jgi:hypothetical protein
MTTITEPRLGFASFSNQEIFGLLHFTQVTEQMGNSLFVYRT